MLLSEALTAYLTEMFWNSAVMRSMVCTVTYMTIESPFFDLAGGVFRDMVYIYRLKVGWIDITSGLIGRHCFEDFGVNFYILLVLPVFRGGLDS